jgi:hypothetical protein
MSILKNIFIIFLFLPSALYGEYKNTDGTALEKTFSDMIKWIRSDQEPVLTSI